VHAFTQKMFHDLENVTVGAED